MTQVVFKYPLGVESGQWFANHYECSECGERWSDEWDCMCDDECPNCGTDNSPYESEELSPEDSTEI